MVDDDRIKTGEVGLPRIDHDMVTSNRDLAKTFVYYLIDTATRMAPDKEWTRHDLIEVIRFAEADGLQGVDFHEGHTFQDRLVESIERADRYGENFSVMIIKMDGPHDAPLYASILDAMVERLRRSDKVFLFHGRAAILLPYTSGKDLSTFKDRIQGLLSAVLDPEAAIEIEHAAYPSRLGTKEAMMRWAADRIT